MCIYLFVMTKNSHSAKYEAPQILARVPFEMEGSILTASVVEYIEAVETIGHEVDEVDFSESQFNHTWE